MKRNDEFKSEKKLIRIEENDKWRVSLDNKDSDSSLELSGEDSDRANQHDA